jgi:GDP-4-dehydro-6-deoxy-D-mannose reductase
MRVLITGAGGFVGRHLVTALRAAYPGIVLIETGLRLDAGAVEPLDITDFDAVRAKFAAARPDFCFHLAAISAVPLARAAPERSWAVNLHGSLAVARAILQAAPDCGLIFASTSEIYGASFRSGKSLDEQALLAPMNLYAATKAAADLALGAMENDGLRLVRLRPFNHIGPGQDTAFAIASFARQIAAIEAGSTKPELMVGNLDAYRDFLDVRDVVDAYALCLRHFVQLKGQVLNIASGQATRIGDVLQSLIGESTAPRIDVTIDPTRLRGPEITHAIGDASRARALLGWQPRTPLRQTLADMLAWSRAH